MIKVTTYKRLPRYPETSQAMDMRSITPDDRHPPLDTAKGGAEAYPLNAIPNLN